MATYSSDKIAAGVQAKALPSAGGVNALAIANLVTALLLNDIINMLTLEAQPSIYTSTGVQPNGPTIIGMTLDSDKLDSNVAPVITLDVGDQVTGAAATPQRFFAASNIAQAGGFAIPTIPAILGYQPFLNSFNTYTTNSLLLDTIFVKVHAAPATWAAGKIRLIVEYSYDP